jgi:hypothetical protein
LNITRVQITEKISADMLSHCYKKIDDKTVNGIFQNLTVINLNWNDLYDPFVDIDYSMFKSNFKDLELEITSQQITLFAKLDRAREEFMSIQRLKKTLTPNGLNLFGIDFSKISDDIKLFFIIGFLTLFILGTLFLLNRVNNKDKFKKKKNK